MRLLLSFLVVVLLLVVARPGLAVDDFLLYTFTGDSTGHHLGGSVSGAGDVNNDGFDDIIVGAPSAGVLGEGRAYVHSGESGIRLFTFFGDAGGSGFGGSVSGAGDVNNDGFDDLMVGASGAGDLGQGQAYVYSGQNGTLLYTFTGEAAGDRFGRSVSQAGDVNNDGFDDLIVGAYRSDVGGDDAGRAYVYSGQSGALIFTYTGEVAGDYFGYSVSQAGDVNNDGFDDLIVGAFLNEAGGPKSGRAYVYSGQNGDLLYAPTGEGGGNYFGVSVSGAGDVNNDGFDDLIVGAEANGTKGEWTGRAYVYSGQNGNLLYTFTGEALLNFFGQSVSGAGDVNNDGFDDLIVGALCNDAGGDYAGRAYVYSGQSGALIFTYTGEAAGDRFGTSVSQAGDVNNDGFDDLIVGAYRSDVGGDDAGRAYVFVDGFVCGDIDGSGGYTNVADLTYLVDYLFGGGPQPYRPDAADLDGSGSVDVADLTSLVDYLFRGGPEPICQ